ncbi:nucleotide-diphospho-sugar transferase [Limtongia smithiae]|uniref:nucleotide-diphospho-sugar transferase n=1 Tax=Limtongia smithiae TaxID=1125753 RepID=UPI0034CF8E7A
MRSPTLRMLRLIIIAGITIFLVTKLAQSSIHVVSNAVGYHESSDTSASQLESAPSIPEPVAKVEEQPQTEEKPAEEQHEEPSVEEKNDDQPAQEISQETPAEEVKEESKPENQPQESSEEQPHEQSSEEKPSEEKPAEESSPAPEGGSQEQAEQPSEQPNQESAPEQSSEEQQPTEQAQQESSAAPVTTAEAGAYQRANATFVTLARNQDVWSMIRSIRHVEDRFNHQFHYDWVFLNDDDFDDDFKETVSALVSGTAKFGKIPKENWGFPDWIDKERAAKTRQEMAQKKIIYGDSVSYRHMCRFESGFFFRQELTLQYKYYWRVEPEIQLHCDIDYDVFKFMEEKEYDYGFTLSLYEYAETIPTLWDSVRKFMKEHPEHLAKDNLIDWLSDDEGFSYNRCHFWSNFEIGNMDFWRSQAYMDFFNSLDQDGGFFYERWGDAPVHSIAASLLLPKNKVHYFQDIGYWHVPFTNCPTNREDRLRLKCSCNPRDNFSWKGYSCTPKFFDVQHMTRPSQWREQS